MPAVVDKDRADPIDAFRRFIAKLAADILPTMSCYAAWLEMVFHHANYRHCNAAKET
jgi:hypothetical protein